MTDLPSLIALARDLERQLAAEREARERMQRVCAAAYQLAGVVGAPTRFLDALGDSANGEPGARTAIDSLLPIRPGEIECEARRAEAEVLLQSVSEWYERDGSVGGCDVVMESVRAFLAQSSEKP